MIYRFINSLSTPHHYQSSITLKIFRNTIHNISHKLWSLGTKWTLKITSSVAIVIVFVFLITSMGGKSPVMAFADNSLSIKDVDDAYISLDGTILDGDEAFGARFAYMIKPGDTLETIAREFGVTINSLKDTNGLTSNTIKSGQEIIISNVDGFVYQITQQTTIRDFANQYRLDLQDLKELNSLQNDHDILKQWDQVFIPLTLNEGKTLWLIVPEPEPEPVVAPVVAPKPSKTTTTKSYPSVKVTTTKAVAGIRRVSQTRSACFGFVPGQCTCYAAQKRPDIFKQGETRPFGGNAKNRYTNAKNAGFDVGTNPAIWAVAVMTMWRWGYGHVGIVVDIDKSNDTVLLESMNWVGPYIVNRIWISTSRIKWYIY